MGGCVAVLNAGSSSIKFALYGAEPGEPVLFRGRIEAIGVAPRLLAVDGDGVQAAQRAWDKLDHAGATTEILNLARELIGPGKVQAVGHRVVHGGTRFAAPVRVDAEILAGLRELVPLAPLHQPHNLAAIATIAAAVPELPQVACFDTAFHRDQPPLGQMFGIPRRYWDDGVRRYGFHGLSYEYVSGRLRVLAPKLAAGRVIIAHLGNGASLCGLAGGHSMVTTMGFTAADGLLMGTRCGVLDPGVLIHLMDAYGLGPRELEALIYKQSGLLGVSGVSSDMRALRASPSAAAAEAVALFVYRAVREIGSIAAGLGGLDGLVFTGGIGENDAAARAEIAAGCAWLGLELDADRNAAGGPRISSDASRIESWVVPTDEERMIARHTMALLGFNLEAA